MGIRSLMRTHFFVRVLMAIQAVVLLLPTTLIYSIGFLGWNFLFIPAAILTLAQRISHEGLQKISQELLNVGHNEIIFIIGFTVFMFFAGAGLLATWILLGIAYSGERLKNVKKLLWVALVAGWGVAVPSFWWGTPDHYREYLVDYLFFRSLIGLGPLLSSIFVLVWLYWSEIREDKKSS